LAQGALLSAIAFLAARSRGRDRNPIAVSAGAALLGVGAGIFLAGAAALGRNLTPFPKPVDGSVLVRQGVFSVMRHPIYTGLMMMSVGWALVWQSAPALVIALGTMPFLDAKTRREEQWLRERFPDYGDYQRRVKRFVPGLY
jgi:protein-S-isoprenylcysteine O-methyltransferase Ste14